MESIPDAPLSPQAMDSHHHRQLEGLLICPKNQQCQQQLQQPQLEIKVSRPRPEPAIKCPRCASTNTKFCYYNNYSLAQPRYFCKSCRRYWTQGGSLRNVPVGGGCRKNKRQIPHSSSSSSSSSSKQHKPQEQVLNTAAAGTNGTAMNNTFNLIPPAQLSSDLTLAFAGCHRNPTAVGGVLLPSSNNGFLVDASPVGLSNLYFGFGGGGGAGDSTAAGALYYEGGGDAAAAASAVRTVVDEIGSSCNNKDMEEGHETSKVLMGLPWQMGGGGGGGSGEGNMSSVDSGRDWTSGSGTGGASSWHGLINSSFMSGARMDMTTSLGDAYAFF